MTDLRNRKRQRVSQDEVDEKPFLNHPTLYFDDGNVIFRAGWTLFCVHKSLLSKHSPVFKDLFQQKHSERFRGLCQITMKETREDLETLLNVIYDGLRVDVQELTVETFPTVAIILRTATKYKVERPCQDIVARIRAHWPATLTQHDAREAQIRAAKAAAQAPAPPYANDYAAGPSNAHRLHPRGGAAEPIASRAGGGPTAGPSRAAPPAAAAAPVDMKEDLIVHPGSVIALLRECGYDDASLLFPLFYALSRTTWQFGGPALGHHLAPLLASDVERLVVGVERLRSAHTSLAVAAPNFDPVPSNPPHFCLNGAQTLWGSLVCTLFVTRRQLPHEPLEEWREMATVVSTEFVRYQICTDCCRGILAKIVAHRQNLWNSLPKFFELV